MKKRFWDAYEEYFGMLNPKTNVGKLASSLSNLHISKMAAKLEKNL